MQPPLTRSQIAANQAMRSAFAFCIYRVVRFASDSCNRSIDHSLENSPLRVMNIEENRWSEFTSLWRKSCIITEQTAFCTSAGWLVCSARITSCSASLLPSLPFPLAISLHFSACFLLRNIDSFLFLPVVSSLYSLSSSLPQAVASLHLHLLLIYLYEHRPTTSLIQLVSSIFPGCNTSHLVRWNIGTQTRHSLFPHFIIVLIIGYLAEDLADQLVIVSLFQLFHKFSIINYRYFFLII